VTVRTVAFDPVVHGFAFPNAFVDVFVALPNGMKLQTAGRCGGMAYAALDYWYADTPAPRFGSALWAPSRVPPDGHWLADAIRRRLFDSFRVGSAVQFVTWTLAPDEARVVRGVTRWTKEDQFPQVVAAIEAGRPVPLGLISARRLDRIGDNHQVVAYGYDRGADGTLTVVVCDNNSPGESVLLTSGPDDRGWTASNGATWRGFFVQDYTPKNPRDLTDHPASADAVVAAGSEVRLTHAWTGFALGSDELQDVRHPGTFRVTAAGTANDDELWRLVPEPADGTPTPPAAMRDGDQLGMRHVASGRFLTSRTGERSPVTGQQLVSTSAAPTSAEATWRVEVDGGGPWTAGDRVRLVHVASGAALHSHPHPVAQGLNEVTAFAGRDTNDWWSVLALA
jgi:hypothetical protein